MFETSSNQRGEGPRVDLEASVRILSFGQPKAIWATTHNISNSGMFVETADLCPMNTELLCDLFLPFTRLPVRGLVVWVQHQPVCGMGIMFLDLSEHDRTLIQDAINGFTEHCTPVKVWMETLAQPIQAQAVRNGRAMTLRSQLSFLRLSSPVVVYPNTSDAIDPSNSTSGILQNVTLSADPQHKDPVLQLHLKIQDPETEPDSAPRICTPVVEEPATQDEPDEPAELKPHEEWEVDLSDLDQSDWKLQSEHPTLKIEHPRKHSRPWLWLAALLMVGLTVASVLYTNLYQRAWDRFQAWLAAPPDLSSVENHIASLYPSEPSASRQPGSADPADPPQPGFEKPVPAVDPPQPGSLDPEDPPQPGFEKSAPAVDPPQPGPQGHSIEIALRGSTEGATSYRLADPNGIAVNLPKARARRNLGIRKVNQGPIRSVWLRKREGGVQLRVMVKGDLPDYELKLSPDKVKVTLK